MIFISIFNKIKKIIAPANKMVTVDNTEEPTIPVITGADITNLDKYNEDWKKYIEYYENNCKPIDNNIKNMTLLVVSDTHNQMTVSAAENLIPIVNQGIDACLICGDISISDMFLLSKTLPSNKTCGILGNHDSFSLYDKYQIKNINGKTITTSSGITIAGIHGSIKYKVWDHPSYTHEESLRTASKIEAADILITHDIPYLSTNNRNIVHRGMVGITKYLFDNQTPLNIHGHLHEDSIETLPNGTKSIGVYGVSLIEIKDNQIDITKIPFK